MRISGYPLQPRSTCGKAGRAYSMWGQSGRPQDGPHSCQGPVGPGHQPGHHQGHFRPRLTHGQKAGGQMGVWRFWGQDSIDVLLPREPRLVQGGGPASRGRPGVPPGLRPHRRDSWSVEGRPHLPRGHTTTVTPQPGPRGQGLGARHRAPGVALSQTPGKCGRRMGRACNWLCMSRCPRR